MVGTVRAWLDQWISAGLAAVQGGPVVERAIIRDGRRAVIAGRTIPDASGVHVVAIGKAAASMAAAAVAVLGDRLAGGLIVTRDGHAASAPPALPVRYAAHPIPDARSSEAGLALLDAVAAIDPGDVLLVLLSGGGSALTTCPADGLASSDLRVANEALLACGATIDEVNCLRKHLGRVGGGGLAGASTAAQTHVLVVSDVVGDRLDVIASGPFAPDPTTFRDALAIVERHELGPHLPLNVMARLAAGVKGRVAETRKAADAAFARVHHTIVARNADARRAVLDAAGAGVDLGEVLGGEASRMGRRLAAIAAATRVASPTLLVAGGECIVHLRGDGLGGRNQELALAAAIAWEEAGIDRDACLLAVGTDGSDGPTDAAGGLVDAGSACRARASGCDPRDSLARNDSHRCLDASGDLIRTGPTDTNVMDLVLLWTGGDPAEIRGR